MDLEARESNTPIDPGSRKARCPPPLPLTPPGTPPPPASWRSPRRSRDAPERPSDDVCVPATARAPAVARVSPRRRRRGARGLCLRRPAPVAPPLPPRAARHPGAPSRRSSGRDRGGGGRVLLLRQAAAQVGARVAARRELAQRRAMRAFFVGQLLEPRQHRWLKHRAHPEAKGGQLVGRKGRKTPPIHLEQPVARLAG